MKRKALIALAVALAFAAAPFFSPVSAHCPDNPPQVRMTLPSEGVAIQQACYQGYATCFVDTFYSARLRDTLAALYRSRKYAVFGYVDSVRNYQTFDSVYYMGQLYYIDTFTTEQVDVSIHTFLKDSLPVRNLTFIDRWIPIGGDPLSTTHIPLKDTPFVAFFDRYDSLKHMGIAPMDGCFFEPTVFAIHHDGIHRKGVPGDRMPGISVTLEDFFEAVELAPVPAPPILHRPSYRKPRNPPGSLPRYQINGRRLGTGTRKARGWVFSTDEP